VVSLSPTKESSADDILEYDKGWAATNKLLRQGASFSSHEKNCAYLNTGAQQFANVSAVTGLDLGDDGRGLALCDWDFDGRTDFWVTNRTGPRVRFLHNEFESDNHFAGFRLRGTTASRDAIGARVEVYPVGAERPLIQTLYAGSGYLSQGSKWLRFGLGKSEAIERVIVRWPGAEAETFEAPAADSYHELVQGSGKAVAWRSPATSPAPLTASTVSEPASGDASRVVLLRPAPLPESLTFTGADGQERTPSDYRGRPFLLNLWATWCPNCLAETKEWSARKSEFDKSSIAVLSLCVDEPSGDPAADLAKAVALAGKMGFAFPVAVGDANDVAILDIFQKSFIGRQTDVPLPSSFLVDAEGQVAVIYKGPADVEQIVTDSKLLGAAPDAIIAGAIPFPGKWLEIPPATEARNVAIGMIDHSMPDMAEAYLRQILPLYDKAVPNATEHDEEIRVAERIQCHVFLGAILFDAKRFDEALVEYDTVLAADPKRSSARDQKSRALVELGRKEEALAELTLALASRETPEGLVRAARLDAELGHRESAIARFQSALAQSSDPETHNELANLLRDSGDTAGAIAHYKAALATEKPSPLTANNLAWILATHPEASFRNGAEAIRLATLALDATNRSVPHFFSTLAAAQAESGDFDAALESIDAAIGIAEKKGDADLAARFAEKRALYQKQEPFRETDSQ
jgi:tetratricopeptide (TPR) repeat protein/peroxiredoxin